VFAPRVVIDTNVLTGALLRREGQNRQVLRACLESSLQPLVGQALLLEYEDVLGRQQVFRRSPLNASERQQLFEAFLGTCEWVQVYYLWRPNLRDEKDNHVVELGVAGGASMIVTNNLRDFSATELSFPDIRVISPAALVKELG
jgi:uncharacterized protein